MITIVPKIGTGTQDNPFHPDTNAEYWQVVEERETEFVIEILE